MKLETEAGLVQLCIDTGCFCRPQNEFTLVVSVKAAFLQKSQMKPGCTPGWARERQYVRICVNLSYYTC